MTVVGDEDTVRAFVDKVQGTGPNYPNQGFGGNLPSDERADPKDLPVSVLEFHQTVPVPEEIQVRGFDKAGYNWQVENWGTKWGAYGIELVRHEPTYVKYSFDTAWHLPDEWLSKTSSLFPTLEFFLSYSEESPSRGRVRFKNGKMLDDIHEGYSFDEGYPEYDDERAKKRKGL